VSDKTLQEEMAELSKAWLDLMYGLLKPLLPLYRRLGVKEFKPWVREREIRERHRKPPGAEE
jgi:hypothetical protein